VASRWKNTVIPYSQLKSLLSVFDGNRIEVDLSVWLYDLRKELMGKKVQQENCKALSPLQEFLKFSNKTPYLVSNEDVRNYLYHLAERKNASASTLNIAINALKFYYGEVLKRRFAYEIRRPKKDKKLPVVLSQEVSRILSSVTNLKHRLILMLMYSAGLRVGEVVKLNFVPIKEVKIKSCMRRKSS